MESDKSKQTDNGNESMSAGDPDIQGNQLTHGASDAGSYYQRLLDGVLNNLLDGIITIDNRGKIITINPAISKMTGYEDHELLGNNVKMLMGDHIAALHDAYLQNGTQKPQVIGSKRYLQVFRKDGSFFLAEIAISKMQLDDEMIFIGSVYDVTDKVAQEKRIWELARFPEETWNPVLKISAGGVLDYANPRCSPILDAWQTAIQGQVPDEIKHIVQQCVSNGQSQEFEVECQRADTCEAGQCFKLFFAPVPDLKSAYVYGVDISQAKRDQNELAAHRNILEDIVKERTKEADSALREAERANQAKSLFLANMSHEIRTPLTSIIGYAETLLDDGQDRQAVVNSVQTIIRSGHHLKNIINDILDLSKIEAGKMESECLEANLFDVMHEVQTAVKQQAEEKGLQFKIEYSFPLPGMIVTDPVRFKQILLNLCSNAIKFTQQGRVVIKVSYDETNTQFIVSVLDTGIGMTNEQLNKIFKPFVQADTTTTREYGGTGLGLSLSKRLSEILGGELTVKSEPGQGSQFSLKLPLGKINDVKLVTEVTTTRRIDKTEVQSMEQTPLKGRVLLAEDTPELQLLIKNYIAKTGMVVDVVNNGEEAVNAAQTNDYELLFMDIQMPVMDGYTAVKTLRERGYDKPIIAMTANAMREDRERCLNVGCDDFVAKPVQRSELYKILDKFSQSPGTEQDEGLASTLYQTDPDMVGMLGTFLAVLPDYIDQCESALKTENWQDLKRVLHILKGMGGSYGYDIITDTAAEGEDLLEAEDYKSATACVEKLAQLNSQVQRGHKQQAG